MTETGTDTGNNVPETAQNEVVGITVDAVADIVADAIEKAKAQIDAQIDERFSALGERIVKIEEAMSDAQKQQAEQAAERQSGNLETDINNLRRELAEQAERTSKRFDDLMLEFTKILDVPPVIFPDLSGLQRKLDEVTQNIIKANAQIDVLAAKVAMADGETAKLTARLNAEPDGAADGLPADLAGREALLEDGRFTTTKALQMASDEELDSVKGIGAATVKSIRSALNQAEKQKETADE